MTTKTDFHAIQELREKYAPKVRGIVSGEEAKTIYEVLEIDKRNVLKNGGLYNLMAREYQYNTADVASASEIYTTSYAVVHQIDGPLMWEKDDEAELGF